MHANDVSKKGNFKNGYSYPIKTELYLWRLKKRVVKVIFKTIEMVEILF
jgi:hypothetical protein